MYGPHKKELSGGEAQTTNNRMELTGVITALEALKEPCVVELYSDSKYVIDALEKGWAKGWRARGWVKGDKKPALNPGPVGPAAGPVRLPPGQPPLGQGPRRATHTTTAVTSWRWRRAGNTNKTAPCRPLEQFKNSPLG